ncbi:MAG: hypothetical protein H6702_20480 [Myxococcales bacterium]|nr:hypothetical protein [Myxococcales bacterium]
MEGALRAGAQIAHAQGVVLPHLIAAGDVVGLAAVAEDRKAPEVSRLGALEALARIPREAAVAPLLAVAKDDDEDEAVRKAAWRAVRRHRRAQARAEVQR